MRDSHFKQETLGYSCQTWHCFNQKWKSWKFFKISCVQQNFGWSIHLNKNSKTRKMLSTDLFSCFQLMNKLKISFW